MGAGRAGGARALVGPARRFVLSTPSLAWIGIFASLGMLVALMAYKDQHPLNAKLLFAWTLVEAYTIGVIVAGYAAAGQGRLVVEALVLTLSVFAVLTLFTFQFEMSTSNFDAFINVTFISLTLDTFHFDISL